MSNPTAPRDSVELAVIDDIKLYAGTLKDRNGELMVTFLPDMQQARTVDLLHELYG